MEWISVVYWAQCWCFHLGFRVKIGSYLNYCCEGEWEEISITLSSFRRDEVDKIFLGSLLERVRRDIDNQGRFELVEIRRSEVVMRGAEL